MEQERGPLIGVLAIQGAVSEHVDACVKLGARAVEIRYPNQILQPEEPLAGIILPGGGSTAMSIVGEQTGIFPALRQWVLASPWAGLLKPQDSLR